MVLVKSLLRAVLLWMLLSSPLPVSSQSQDCPMLQNSQLGSNTTFSNTGLLADALAAKAGDGSVLDVQIMEVNTVCLGQGTQRDTYRSTSLIVSYISTADVNTVTVQVHYQCLELDGRPQWSTNNFGTSETSVSDSAGGNLTTSLRTDCILCVDSTTGPVASSADEHCAGKDCSLLSPVPTLFVKGGV